MPVTWAFSQLAEAIDGVLETGSGPTDWFLSYNQLEQQAYQTLSDTLELQAALGAIAVARESMSYWSGPQGTAFMSAGLVAASAPYPSLVHGCTISHPHGYSGMLKEIGNADVKGVVAGVFGGLVTNMATGLLGVATAISPVPVLVGAAAGFAGAASAEAAYDYLQEHTTCH